MNKTLPLVAVTALLSACGRPPAPTDLIDAGDSLVEASAAGLGRPAILAAVPSGLRINDVLYRGFPAGPPGGCRP